MMVWNFANTYLVAAIITSLFFIALYFWVKKRI